MSNTLRILFAGDFCPIGPVEEMCRKGYWEALYGDVRPELADKDVSVVNLECPLADAPSPIAKTGPNLIAPTHCVESLVAMQADVAALANNHILDQGETGLRSTLAVCRERGIATVGAGEDLAEAARPLFIERNGWRIALLNFAENEWSTTHGKTPGAAPLDPVNNALAIRAAAREADAVIVVVHGGHELYSLPSPRMVKLYRFYVEMGAAAVVGHHTHVIGAYEMYHDAPIYYSLGNFIFPWSNKSESWRTGMLLRLELRRGAPAKHERVFVRQADSNAALRLLTEKESDAVEQKLNELNAVLAADSMLASKWREFADRRQRIFTALFLGYGKWRRRLAKRGLWPLRVANRMFRLNLLRCESHFDLLKYALGRDAEKGGKK